MDGLPPAAPKQRCLAETGMTHLSIYLSILTLLCALWCMQFVQSYFSIEHNEGWYNDMKDEVAKIPKVKKYMLSHVPDGYKGWGGGIDEGSFEQFKDYVTAVDQFQASQSRCTPCVGVKRG